jgi:hypothetical protein
MTALGIDFGTTNSSMAWYNPKSGQAELIKNAEGQDETPSVVYYGEDDVQVGRAAEHALENEAASEEELQRIVTSIKRHLINPPRIALPKGKDVRPVDVVSEILRKLKHDAETGHFYREVTRAVITCPALFDSLQRKVLVKAAELAGFQEVDLLDEPVAAALAFARGGQRVGNGVLVYDLGGGTFDLAFVRREDEEKFYLALETDGKVEGGGDDFDQFLYDYWDGQARKDLGRSISLANAAVNRPFLRQCRIRKEDLSLGKQCKFQTLLPDRTPFRPEIDRETFENLIRGFISETVRQTVRMVQRAKERGYEVDTVLMVGGSCYIPLVRRMLEEALLPISPLRWQHQNVAVALGAAYRTHQLWGTKEDKPNPTINERRTTPDAEFQEPEKKTNAKPDGRPKIKQESSTAAVTVHCPSCGTQNRVPTTKTIAQAPCGRCGAPLAPRDAVSDIITDWLELVVPKLQMADFQCWRNAKHRDATFSLIAIGNKFDWLGRKRILLFADASAFDSTFLDLVKSYLSMVPNRSGNVLFCFPILLMTGLDSKLFDRFVGLQPYHKRYIAGQDFVDPAFFKIDSRQLVFAQTNPPHGLGWTGIRQKLERLLVF